MLGRLLKPIFPNSLMGRAALILVIPVAGLLLIVSAAVFQRHYDRVTRQLTVEFVRVADHLVARAGVAPQQIGAEAQAFGLDARLAAGAPLPEPGPWLAPWHVSARVVHGALTDALPQALALRVTATDAQIALPTPSGPLVLALPLSRLTASNPHQLLVVTLAAAAVMTWISFVFLRNQMRPIRRLAGAAEAFGRGDSVDLHISGATEVRAAARAFLDMRARIEAQIEARTLMLSGVSHDLRTPLTRLRLGLSLMDDPEAQGMLADLAQMEGLIDRYLDFVRDGTTEAPTPVDLGALVEARARAVGVPVRPGGPRPHLHLRPALFARALDNVLGNALRYGERGDVWIEDGAGWVAVCVEDAGPGIPEDARARALKPFVRLDPARTADGGVGLGLAIAADAMTRQGGRIELETGTTPGLGGLRARLILPDQRSNSAQTGV